VLYPNKGKDARMTFTEFEKLPETVGNQELLDGELIELPPSKLRHDQIAKRFFKLLLAVPSWPVADLGDVYHEVGYRIGNGWLKPDLSIAKKDQPADDYYIGAPALAIEVISNEKTADKVDRKLTLYFQDGANQVWVVFPESRRMWVYFPDGTAEVHSGSYDSQLLGITLNLEELLG
jgi:Uma2 family endonuclease